MLRACLGTALAAGATAACLLIASTVQAPHAVATHEPAEASARAAPIKGQTTAFVTLDPDGQEKGGVETASLQAIPYQDQVRAYGTVLALDRLTGLYNQVIAASAQLQGTKVKLTSARIAEARAKNLLKVFATAQVQAEAAEATAKIDAASVEAAQAQVDILRNTAVQDWGAKLGGAIVARGALVEDLVLRRRVLVQLTLKPGALAKPPARVTLTYEGMAGIEAEFISDATQVDPKIQNVSFWYAAPAGAGLVAGTSILALLPKGDSKPGVGIPPSAVVWQAGKPWLFVREGANRFERRPIDDAAAPMADGGFVVPAASLPGDERIVVAGAQTLLSEEARVQLPAQEDDN